VTTCEHRPAAATLRLLRVGVADLSSYDNFDTLNQQTSAAARVHAMRNKAAVELYRSILKLHRTALPAAHRAIGDKYIQAEFRAHKDAKQEHVERFMQGWNDYHKQLKKQANQFGRALRPEEEASLSSEQREKLQELKQRTKT
jgi:Complex1_LYR-like